MADSQAEIIENDAFRTSFDSVCQKYSISSAPDALENTLDLEMSQVTPVRMILRYREQPFQKLAALINAFFAWRDIQPLDDYCTHICSNPPSSQLYLVLDLYCKTHPNVDLDKLDLAVFKVSGSDSLCVTSATT